MHSPLPPSRLTRRRLLQAIAVGTAAMTLQGCKTMPTMPSLGGMAGRLTGGDRRYRVNEEMGQRPWSPDDQQLSDRSRWLVDAARSRQPVPLVTSELAHPDRLPEVERDWMNLVEQGKAAGETSLNQHFSMAMLSTPIVVQQVLQQDKSLLREALGTAQPAVRGDVIEVPAGTMVRARFQGSCMDDKLPAPSRGEPLMVRPIDGYIHPRLEELNAGVSRLRGQGAMSYEEFQHLTWAIRNAGVKDNPFIDKLEQRHVNLLNRAAPQGYNTLQMTHAAEAHNPLNDLADGLMTELNQRLQLNLNGQTLGPRELFDRFASNGGDGGVDQAINMMVGALTSQEAKGPVPGGAERGYTMLNDHVAVQATAADNLDPEIWFVNAGVEPWTFDPTKYVLESPRDTQRVGLPSQPMPAHFEGWPLEMADNEGVQTLGQRMRADLKLFTVDTLLREAVDLRKAADLVKTPVGSLWHVVEHAKRLGGRVFRSLIYSDFADRYEPSRLGQAAVGIGRFALRHGADYLPIVGNMFSLYELVAGHHILERDNPSSMPERGLAAIGVIPGGRAVAGISYSVMKSERLKRVTNDLSRRAAVMLRKYSRNSAVTAVEEAAALRDIAWWMLSDSHEVLAGDADVALDNRFSQPWDNTISYIKSL